MVEDIGREAYCLLLLHKKRSGRIALRKNGKYRENGLFFLVTIRQIAACNIIHKKDDEYE